DVENFQVYPPGSPAIPLELKTGLELTICSRSPKCTYLTLIGGLPPTLSTPRKSKSPVQNNIPPDFRQQKGIVKCAPYIYHLNHWFQILPFVAAQPKTSGSLQSILLSLQDQSTFSLCVTSALHDGLWSSYHLHHSTQCSRNTPTFSIEKNILVPPKGTGTRRPSVPQLQYLVTLSPKIGIFLSLQKGHCFLKGQKHPCLWVS
ncbi:hypothetical protein STEG23_011515, partial [Scotinomys teguina]